MPKSIYVGYLTEQPNTSIHYLNRLVKVLNHFISIEPPKKIKGFESHHIFPKSWKPEWSKEPDNLLKVPAKAHYVIHHLMWKAFPEDNSMRYAFWQTSNRLKQKITAKVFENLKNNLSHSEETKRKMKRKDIAYETESLLIEKEKLFPTSTNRKLVILNAVNLLIEKENF